MTAITTLPPATVPLRQRAPRPVAGPFATLTRRRFALSARTPREIVVGSVGLQVFQNDVANEIRWTSLSRSVDPWGGGSVGRIHQDFILYWTVWRGHSCPWPLTLFS